MILDGLSKICYAFLDLGKRPPQAASEKHSIEEVSFHSSFVSLFYSSIRCPHSEILCMIRTDSEFGDPSDGFQKTMTRLSTNHPLLHKYAAMFDFQVSFVELKCVLFILVDLMFRRTKTRGRSIWT
jgi:hypothetical protein